MASRNVPGMHGRGNQYTPALLGAYGLSPCHGGGLWAPVVFRREIAGRADAPRQRAGTALVCQPRLLHERSGTSQCCGRLPLLTRCSPLPTERDLTCAPLRTQYFRRAQDQAAGLDWAVRSAGDKREQGGGYPRARCHADSAPSISVLPVAGSAGVWGSGRSRSLAPGAALAHTAGSTRPCRPCPR